MFAFDRESSPRRVFNMSTNKSFRILAADHTGITVSNLERSLAFWRDVLGFELSHTAHQTGELASEITGVPGAEIKLAVVEAPGGHKIELLEYLAPADQKRYGNLRPCDLGHTHVALLVDDLESVLERIAAHGWRAAGKAQTLPSGPNAGKRVVYVRDPDGATIEFMQPPQGNWQANPREIGSAHMKRLVIAAIACCVFCHCSRHYDEKAAERYIRESEAQWAESVATGDTAAVERILADDFVGVDPKGGLYDKQQMIANTRNAPKYYASNHLNEVKIRFYGDTAIAHGSESWRLRTGARGRFIWTDTWLRRDGRWQIVAAEDLAVSQPNADAQP
jgi:catechol 2,3-dioxygenase-like lactoylglutathione lyase family enzyme/ketosteroid isomerase-like protein